jgi:hypothetical protein
VIFVVLPIVAPLWAWVSYQRAIAAYQALPPCTASVRASGSCYRVMPAQLMDVRHEFGGREFDYLRLLLSDGVHEATVNRGPRSYPHTLQIKQVDGVVVTVYPNGLAFETEESPASVALLLFGFVLMPAIIYWLVVLFYLILAVLYKYRAGLNRWLDG